MTNQVEVTKKAKVGLVQMQEGYIERLKTSLNTMELKMDSQQTHCVGEALKKIYEISAGQDENFIKNNNMNIMSIIKQISMLKLNVAATPSECYLITRKTKVGEDYVQLLEFGIEGDGNDKLVREYGVDVEKVYPIWVVRENDEFTPPTYVGIDVQPPKWTPQDFHSKVVKVVYPIQYKDGTVIYHTVDREGVAKNCKAAITNSNEIRYEPKDKIKAERRKRILDMIHDATLEELLSNDDCLALLGPAWTGAASQEAMILRKMRNNVTKAIPKDFGNAYAADAYKQTFEDYDQYEKPAVERNKDKEIDVEFTERAATEELAAPKIESIVNEPVANQPTHDPYNEETGEVITLDLSTPADPY